MRILVIGHSYVVDSNRQFWNQFAKNENCQVDIVTPKVWHSNLIKIITFNYNVSTDQHLNQIYPTPVYKSGNGSFYHFHWLSFYKILFRNKYDSIFIFQETWSFSLAQLIILKLFSKNYNSQIHLAVCQNIIKPKLSWLIPWERLLTFFVKRIWFCTYEILKVLKYKGITSQTAYLPFTFDQNIYSPKIKEIKNVIKIGFIGRLTEEKGIFDLVDACKLLIAEGQNIELHLAGGGSLEKDLNNNFIIKHGVIPHIEAHHFYQKIDILVLPSHTKKFWKEQFGRVLVEATASGTPVVGSSSGAIPEVIGLIGFGNVFKEQDANDLKEKLLMMIKQMQLPDYPKRMQEAITNTVAFSSHQSIAQKLYSQMKADLID
jgi:glycosyltransferase involved in cell wall biosynthesis